MHGEKRDNQKDIKKEDAILARKKPGIDNQKTSTTGAENEMQRAKDEARKSLYVEYSIGKSKVAREGKYKPCTR